MIVNVCTATISGLQAPREITGVQGIPGACDPELLGLTRGHDGWGALPSTSPTVPALRIAFTVFGRMPIYCAKAGNSSGCEGGDPSAVCVLVFPECFFVTLCSSTFCIVFL